MQSRFGGCLHYLNQAHIREDPRCTRPMFRWNWLLVASGNNEFEAEPDCMRPAALES